MLISKKRIDGLILAGGQSRRFGSDKALHLIDGRRMIDISIDVVSNRFSKLYVSMGQRDMDLPDSVHKVFDSEVDRGPLQGIYEAMLLSQADWIFVLPCDMPFLSTRMVDGILSSNSKDIDAVLVVDSSDRVIPVLGLYRVKLVSSIEERLSKDQLKVADFAKSLRLCLVRGTRGELRNFNRKDEGF